MATLSVIIPTYNNGHLVTQALESILGQTRPADYIIIIDDGSTDRTKDIIQPFLVDSRIEYIYQPNKGLPAARNTGLRHSHQDLVAFCDADDLWTPQKLERQIAVMEQHPELGLVYGNTRFFQGQRFYGRTSFQLITPHRGQVLLPLFTQNFIHVSSVVVRRAALDQVGWFDESLRSSEDHELWLRLADQFSFDYVSEIVTLYRVQGQSMSRNLLTLATSQLQIHQKIEDLMPDLKIRLGATRRAKVYAGIELDLALASANRGDWVKARTHIGQSRQWWSKLWQVYPVMVAVWIGGWGYGWFYTIRASCSGFNRWTGVIER